MLPGFDAQFSSLEDYILKITESIWEGGKLSDIERFYSSGCQVESPIHVSEGITPVIEGTKKTLETFPDRRLLAEAVLVSGDHLGGYLSSHRIMSPMVYAGAGRFGVPTNKPVFVRTIADCICRDNQIHHEWLVRDHGAIARQIGILPSTLAKDWLRLDDQWKAPKCTVAPLPYRPIMDDSRVSQAYLESLRASFGRQTPRADRAAPDVHARDVIAWHPGGFCSVGVQQREGRIRTLLDGMSFYSLEVESCTLHPHVHPGCMTISTRYRLNLVHNRYGHYGEPTGAVVSVLGIQHADVVDSQVVREWILMDEVAIWMQVLAARRTGV